MTADQWNDFRRRSDSSRCVNCRWQATGTDKGCAYAMAPGHTFRIFVLEDRLGRHLQVEDLHLLEPENCEFYEEREHGRRSGICQSRA